MHEQCTTSKPSNACECRIASSMALVLWRWLIVVSSLTSLFVSTSSIATAVALAAIGLPRILIRALASLAIDEEVAVPALIPLCYPWIWHLRWRRALLSIALVAILLATVRALLLVLALFVGLVFVSELIDEVVEEGHLGLWFRRLRE